MNALTVAKYIINKCIFTQSPITNMRLQYILYLAQERSLKDELSVLFSDDIKAWRFGPVVPKVYYHFCGFGSMPIKFPCESTMALLTIAQINIIDKVVDGYANVPIWELSERTNKNNGPWSITYNANKGSGKVIPIELIRFK